jgi:hypothetical protein
MVAVAAVAMGVAVAAAMAAAAVVVAAAAVVVVEAAAVGSAGSRLRRRWPGNSRHSALRKPAAWTNSSP